MPVPKIITDQHVPVELKERSKELRRQMTPAESILWKHLRAGRLEGFHFRRQQVIDGYIVDFYCHKANLVVEVDGDIHLGQEEYDRDRDSHLRSRDLIVLRFSNNDVVVTLENVLAEIQKVCYQESRGENG